MKSVKVVTTVEEDNEILETHTIEVPLYDTIRLDNVPKEVVGNLVRGFTDDILTTKPEFANAYRVLLGRIAE